MVKKKQEIYKCAICGNMVETMRVGGGHLVCCGQEMELLPEKNNDQGAEKHVPIIEKITGGIKIKVGSAPHPMEPEHFIEWIEISHASGIERKYLNPGDAPEATFALPVGEYSARAFCNIHGLWKSA